MKLFLFLLLFTTSAFSREILLTKDNSLAFRGPVTASSVAEAMHDLATISQRGEARSPIFLVLNTPGGSVMAGIELMGFINTLRRPVHVVAINAASMGFHFLQNSPVRLITEMGTIMSHRANGGTEGDIPQQIESRLGWIKSLLDKMDQKVVSRTKGKHTLKSYRELIRDEYWGVGSNAVTAGFADEVVSLRCDKSLFETVTKEVQIFMFVVKLQFSRCPLITLPKSSSPENFSKVNHYLNGRRGFEF